MQMISPAVTKVEDHDPSYVKWVNHYEEFLHQLYQLWNQRTSHRFKSKLDFISFTKVAFLGTRPDLSEIDGTETRPLF